ncbi:MAG: hypothetical protein GX939_08630 [Clostridiaceae bacterium]|jgi:hypothetical protein|nr:hypothetical protein [Clostridiaceae bacterium]
MDVKELIKNLIGVEVTTDNVEEVMNNPVECTTSKEDAEKLEELVLFLELAKETEEM